MKTLTLTASLIALGSLALADTSNTIPSASASTLFSNGKVPVAMGVSRGSMRSILEPWDDVYLSCQMDGVVVGYPYPEGSRVKKGDVVVELDPRMELAEVAQGEAVLVASNAELTKAEKDFNRVDSLFKERIASEKQLGEVTFALANAKAKVLQAEQHIAAAEVRLSYRFIKSPVDGMFFKKTKSVGEFVQRAEILARVIDDSKIQMMVYAGPDYFGKFQKGDTVDVKLLDGLAKGEIVQAHVNRVDSLIDPANGTFRVQLVMPSSKTVVPGISAMVLSDTVKTTKSSFEEMSSIEMQDPKVDDTIPHAVLVTSSEKQNS
jgi:RND family efflux transporter MFP subunit